MCDGVWVCSLRFTHLGHCSFFDKLSWCILGEVSSHGFEGRMKDEIAGWHERMEWKETLGRVRGRKES